MLSWEQTPGIAAMRCCRAWVEIDLAALGHNVQQLLMHLDGKADLLAVVKANAYGHGAVTVARTALAAGAHRLGGATVPEGIELRQAGIQVPILVMGALNTVAEIQAVAQWRLQPTLVSPKQALIFSETLGQGDRPPLPVHLHLDTGMSRLGCPWQQAEAFVTFVQGLPHLHIASLYSHLATADEPDPTVLQQQHQRFETAIATLRAAHALPPRLHLANSAATLAYPDLHYDQVRVGLALYGLYPAPNLQSYLDLRPVMRVKARVTHTKTIEAGAGVSYGHHFVADRPLRIAVVGIGYADGVPRALSNRMEVLIHGQRARQIGNITMDQMMVDVSGVPQTQEGDVVTLLGQDGGDRITADDWAQLLGTISWEILCGFKHRLPRISLGQPLTHPSEVNATDRPEGE
jgi:alanine racemase